MTVEERKEVKTLNYGIMYGKGEVAFAADYGCSVQMARKLLGEFKQLFEGVFKFKKVRRVPLSSVKFR